MTNTFKYWYEEFRKNGHPTGEDVNVITYLDMVLVAGTGCFVYSLAKLFAQFVGYLWVTLP